MEDRRTHSVTIEDVAREAGVGLGTVSRVLNNHPSVSDSTRNRVMDVVKRLNYRPNVQARRLVKGKAESICFVLSNREFIDPFHARVLHGAQKFFASLGQQVIYLPFDYPDTRDSESLVLPRIISARGVVDGVILAGTNRQNLLNALDTADVPYVVFGNNLLTDSEDVPDSVWFDDRDGGRQVGRHLIEQELENIWFIGNTSQPWFRRRYEGCKHAVEISGKKLNLLSDISAADSIQYGYKAVAMLLDEKKQVDGIFAGNDAIAYGVWKALVERGLKIPDDIALVGFDDRELCVLTTPNLSSVATFNEEVGRECGKMLLEKLQNPGVKMPMVVIPTELVIRGSSDPDKS